MSHEVEALYLTAMVAGVLQAADRGKNIQAAIAAATPFEANPRPKYPTIPTKGTLFSHGEHLRNTKHNPKGTGVSRVRHAARERFSHRSSRHDAV